MTSLILGPIIGGLSHTRANLWARADGPGILHAWLGFAPDLSDAWLAGESLPLAGDTGFAGVAPVAGLSPNTRYYYSLSLDPQRPDPATRELAYFTTLPPPGEQASFSFAFGSCFRPENEQGGAIFRHIAARARQEDLRFLLLLGDQIYADEYRHNGIGRVAASLMDYRQVYAYNFSRPALRDLLARLPAFMTLDDHEVDDDWTWTDSGRTLAQIPIWDRIIRWLQGRPRLERQIPRQRVQDALQAYWEHQGMHAPHFELPPCLDETGQYTLETKDPGSLAYTFTCGAAAFFVLDTRTMRVKGQSGYSMLGDGQWKVLEEWLQRVKDAYPVKFIVTSCTLLFDMWLDFPRDRWSGFPAERSRLLHFLAANDIRGVHLLSGDLHSAHAVRAELYGPQGQPLPVWEFCSSPFEQDLNKFSSFTYTPVRSGLLRRQKLYFCLRQHNFGVVKVDFSRPDEPRVRYQVFGEAGELIGEAGDG